MPRPLSICVVAPSGVIVDDGRVDRMRNFFGARGIDVIVPDAVRTVDQRFAGGDELRLDALHQAAARDDVDIILAARGGYGLSRLLDKIDYDLLADSKKIFVGHSDFTALSLALLAQKSYVSFAGPHALSDFGDRAPSAFTAEFVTLRREMEFVRAYLSIEELRFQDRLQVQYALSPESLEALLPYLILQPLVENAVRHGIALRSGSGRLELRAELRGDRLRIEVRDNGGQLAELGEGLGLANTRARLEQLYGATAQLTLVVDTNGDTVAAIDIPFATSQ